MDTEQRKKLRFIHLRDQIEAIDQNIVDIWWRGIPTQTFITLILTVLNAWNFFVSESPLKYVACVMLLGIWLITISSYIRLYKAVKRYRRSWGKWPKFRRCL